MSARNRNRCLVPRRVVQRGSRHHAIVPRAAYAAPEQAHPGYLALAESGEANRFLRPASGVGEARRCGQLTG